jgi:hypothetical protein
VKYTNQNKSKSDTHAVTTKAIPHRFNIPVTPREITSQTAAALQQQTRTQRAGAMTYRKLPSPLGTKIDKAGKGYWRYATKHGSEKPPSRGAISQKDCEKYSVFV